MKMPSVSLLALSGILLLLSSLSSGQEQPLAVNTAAQVAKPQNNSPMHFDTKQSIFLGSIQFCWRNASGRVRLSDIGIYDYGLRRGMSCVVGDFDGNGFLDFGFQGRTSSEARQVKTFRVVFYGEADVIRTVDLRGEGYFLYPATDLEGQFGEPATRVDGLTIPGEGDSTFVYLFDPKTLTFRESEHASE